MPFSGSGGFPVELFMAELSAKRKVIVTIASCQPRSISSVALLLLKSKPQLII